ncbi:hypothetical protein [Sphingomonas segetis]|jgi:hypothetical protein|uniref:hypothetical protein n=1 Tax=Sphingomonas segetis TaxID=1104779 RepID=UPI0018AD39AE|nr:hypothetical protein [Sphingomonas segetis]
MRCDQCRHWARNEPDSFVIYERWSGLGRCLAVKERWRVLDNATRDRELGWADDTDWDEFGDQPPPENTWEGVRLAALKKEMAVVQDGSDYHAELLTRPDFYCALYSERTGA